jgi:uncharacterized protein YbjT (DUF2867 family)
VESVVHGVFQADLLKPESIPPSLVGIHTIIDCATARPEESIKDIDWEGKLALMQTAKAMGIQRYVFFSIDGCDKHPEVPLMEMKRCTEEYLKELDMPYTVLRLCGFMQALISQYAVPILEEQSVFGTDDQTRTAYLDTQDAARMTMAALRTEATIGKTLTLAGPKAYTIQEVRAHACLVLHSTFPRVTDQLRETTHTMQLFLSTAWCPSAAAREAHFGVRNSCCGSARAQAL